MTEKNKNYLIDEGVDYYKTLLRFANLENLYEKYILSFQDDECMYDFIKAFSENDVIKAFETVHSFKSTAATLGFTHLYELAYQMTELLRNATGTDTDEANVLYKEMIDEYKRICGIIYHIKGDNISINS